MQTVLFVIGVLSVTWALPQVEEEPQFRKLYVDIDEVIHEDLIPRIVNGHEAPAHSIPYQAYIRIYGIGSSWLCAGSLISTRHVLTAAHCLKDGLKAQVYLGYHNLAKLESGQMLVTSTNLIMHEHFSDTSIIVDDIGLITFNTPIETNDFIDVVELPSRTESVDYEGQHARVSGWGRTSGSGATSNVLLEANSTIISNSLCNSFYRIVQNYQICISGLEGVEVCKGDSGGPLVVGNKLVGIVSYNVKNCVEGYPSVFTRITSFLDWIEQHTNLRF